MSDSYTLDIQNNSTQSGHFCIYQQPPDIPDVMPIAWLTGFAHPNTKLQFKWTVNYNFVWTNHNVSNPETQVIDANLESSNSIEFDKVGAEYKFKNQRQGEVKGNLYIEQGENVELNAVSVGIGMSGKGTFVVPSQPNKVIIITPDPTYWLVFGHFEEGKVIDTEITGSSFKVEFKGATSESIEYSDNDTWKLL